MDEYDFNAGIGGPYHAQIAAEQSTKKARRPISKGLQQGMKSSGTGQAFQVILIRLPDISPQLSIGSFSKKMQNK